MRTRKAQRLVLVVVALGLVGAATGLVLASLGQTVAFFTSPTAILTGDTKAGARLRLGGVVVDGSVQRDDVRVHFAVTDYAHAIAVDYTGLLPDLFREGQGVVAIGRLGADGTFQADEILAKHDEGYVPPEVSQALKDAEHWLPEPSRRQPYRTGNRGFPSPRKLCRQVERGFSRATTWQAPG